jgi:hypothetical protein
MLAHVIADFKISRWRAWGPYSSNGEPHIQVCNSNTSFTRQDWGTIISPQSYLKKPINLRDVPRFRHQDFPMHEFWHYWAQGIPVVITHIQMQGTWDPAYFIKVHGERRLTLVNCETGKPKPSSAAHFFKMFIETLGQADGIWKLKVCLLIVSSFHLVVINFSLSRIGPPQASLLRCSLTSLQILRTRFHFLMSPDWMVFWISQCTSHGMVLSLI